jgi:hypothetical protein
VAATGNGPRPCGKSPHSTRSRAALRHARPCGRRAPRFVPSPPCCLRGCARCAPHACSRPHTLTMQSGRGREPPALLHDQQQGDQSGDALGENRNPRTPNGPVTGFPRPHSCLPSTALLAAPMTEEIVSTIVPSAPMTTEAASTTVPAAPVRRRRALRPERHGVHRRCAGSLLAPHRPLDNLPTNAPADLIFNAGEFSPMEGRGPVRTAWNNPSADSWCWLGATSGVISSVPIGAGAASLTGLERFYRVSGHRENARPRVGGFRSFCGPSRLLHMAIAAPIRG